MAKSDDIPYINFDDPAQFARLTRHLHTLRGTYKVELTKVRDQWSASQRGYIWGVCYPYAAHGFKDAWGWDIADSYKAHDVLKRELLSMPILNKRTGELMAHWVRSLGSLDKDDCAKYIDGIHRYSLEKLRVKIPEPSRIYTDPEKAMAG